MKQEMKTPIQELINRLDYLIELSNDTLYEFGLKCAKKEAEQILEKEKEVIKAAYNQGYRDSEIEIGVSLRVGDVSKYSDAQDYYKETFKTKEK